MKLIKNGILVTDRAWRGDLSIQGGKIYKMSPHLEEKAGDEVIDAEGCYVFPGFIDPHTHFNMKNAVATTADDYASGSAKAILGGTTTIINFASPEKGQKNALKEAYRRERYKADAKSSCHYRFHMEVLDFDEDIAAEIQEMSFLGIRSFKVYMAYGFSVNDRQLYRILQAVKKAGGLLEAHCENGMMIQERIREIKEHGITSAIGHPMTRPAEIEAEAISRLAYLGRMADWPVHVVHLSSRLGLEEVLHQRRLGSQITVETCPQYLLLDESRYWSTNDEGLKYIMSPPLRRWEDRKALLEAIEREEIQTLATDHCSYRFDPQKLLGSPDFTKTPGGAPGVGERVALAYTALLHSGRVSPRYFVELLCTNAAKLYGLYPQKGVLAEGSDADIVLYEREGESIIQKPGAGDPMDYTIYEGFSVKGRVKEVFLLGERVVQDSKIIMPSKGIYVT